MKKNRLIFVMQKPTPMRYPEWFWDDFKIELQNEFELIMLGEKYVNEKRKIGWNLSSYDWRFSGIDESIFFEQLQIEEYMKLELDYENDILLLMDLSFPGLFSQILYHKRPKRCFVYCHATSRNNNDIFEKDMISKFMVELGNSRLFNKIFVATHYASTKLCCENMNIIGLPKPKFDTYDNEKKIYNIISVARNCEQKMTKEIENIVEHNFGKIIRTHGKAKNWGRYYNFIGQSKILLSTAKEECFGYSILDAVSNNCVPLAPNKFSYPELLDKKYLYNNIDDLLNKIDLVLNAESLKPPKELLNQELIDNFYKNLIQIMKEE